MALAVLLSGEHESLPLAELRALLAVHDPDATITPCQARVALVEPADEAAARAALGRMALAHAWGDLWGEADETPEGAAALAQAVREAATGAGSIAVADIQRVGGRHADSVLDLRRTLGAAMADAGHAIDLRTPDARVFCWASGGRLYAGLQAGAIDRSRYEARISERRDHFSPVSLHPRRAASLLHLTRAPPGSRVYDPCCGTGTFVLEAALDGHDAWGSDLDAFMVQGTLGALADAGPEPLDGTVFAADVGDTPKLVGAVAGIVSDLPYGRASTTNREDLGELYHRACAAFAAMLPVGGRAVLGCADAALLQAAAQAAGFSVVEHHEEFVHRSLTRHYLILERR